MGVLQVRVDDELKNEAQSVLLKVGLDLPTAIRMFLTRCVYANGVPFPMVLERPTDEETKKVIELMHKVREESKRNGLSNITLDEINAIIKEYREEERQKQCVEGSE